MSVTVTEASTNKVVCVTGASGYIASWLVKLLLQRGYSVKASVRDPLYATEDIKKTGHLLALDGAKERLRLLKADLMEEGSFDAAVDECEGVFHTASPFSHIVTDPQEQLIDPAVKGTLNVLRSCAKVPSIKRVIVTSSMAAVAFNGNPLVPDVIDDETWFSDPAAFCEKSKLWYALSKTLAEETAWKFTEEKGIDMVAINPGLVIGPLLQPILSSSVEPILDLVKGIQISQAIYNRWVDVRDVANAHIQAFENLSATGRYCLVAQVANCSEVLKILHELYPALNLSEKLEDDKPYEPTYQVSKKKAKSLGKNFISWEITLRDTIESLKEKHFLSF